MPHLRSWHLAVLTLYKMVHFVESEAQQGSLVKHLAPGGSSAIRKLPPAIFAALGRYHALIYTRNHGPFHRNSSPGSDPLACLGAHDSGCSAGAAGAALSCR